MFWMWFAVSALTLTIIVLFIKYRLLQKSADEIYRYFSDHITTETNTLIDISCHDKHMLRLATKINSQLKVLRKERQSFQQGDTELKNAVTNIAHDLRTPLTAITGYLQLLEQEEYNETVKRYLGIISNRTEAMKSLTEELFRYSILNAQSDLKFETLKINDVLEDSLTSAYDALTHRGITPEVIMPEGKVKRVLDPSALSRIFENILQNAVKYSAGDLRIELSCDGVIEFSNLTSGLDTVSVGRLFDRFYTVETGRNSTGLGLSIAKLLTERMGGQITAEYQAGRLIISVEFRC